MVRTYKRKTERGGYGQDMLKEALAALKSQPVKAVSRHFRIPARTLRRHRDNKVATVGSLRLGSRQQVLSAAAQQRAVPVQQRTAVSAQQRAAVPDHTHTHIRHTYDMRVL